MEGRKKKPEMSGAPWSAATGKKAKETLHGTAGLRTVEGGTRPCPLPDFMRSCKAIVVHYVTCYWYP